MSKFNLLGLTGKTALVTGASGHLGKVISNTLLDLGANLILIDQIGIDIETFEKRLNKEEGQSVKFYEINLEDEADRRNLIDNVIKKHESLNILINNAAFVGSSSLKGWSVPFEMQSIETWRRAIEVNLTACFQLVQGLTQLIQKSEGGSIVNVSSIYGFLGADWELYEGTTMSNPAAYSASKAGVIQLTKWLATILAPNVRVNCVSPGGLFRNQDNSFVQKYIQKTPLKRMGTEYEIANVIAFLASDMASYMTGQNIIVDGGFSVW